MEPIGISVCYDDEWSILHRCKDCGFIRANRIAGDDNQLALLSLAVRPLGRTPFPIHHMRLTMPMDPGGSP
jgi:hypothetical protein